MATFQAIVFRSSNHLKSDGTTNIKIRVYHNGTSEYIKTPYYITPADMGKGGVILPSNVDCELLNYELGTLVQNYRSLILKLGNRRATMMNCIELKEYLTESEKIDSSIIDFVEFSKKVISETPKEKTAEWYTSALNSLCWFYGREKIDARDITALRLEEFKKQLARKGKSGKSMQPGGISNYLRAIRSLYNKCKEHYNQEDFDIIRIPNDPFTKVKVPKYKRTRKNISIDVIKMIRDAEFDSLRENLARDVFMMLFYLMGINTKDFFELSEIKHGRIEYERSKTNTEENNERFPLSIRVEPELKILFDKYSEGDELLSFFKKRYTDVYNFRKAVNKGLESICEKLEIPKLTTNSARHSWASIARNKAYVSKADVDFCLGHVNNDYKMADIYIDIDYGIFDISNRKVLNLLK